jgi:hypothetical protein
MILANLIGQTLNRYMPPGIAEVRLPPVLILLCCMLLTVSGCTTKTQTDAPNPTLASDVAQTTAASGTSDAQAAVAHATATAQMALSLAAQPQMSILYIYKSDLATAQDYESFIESDGIPVDLITESDALTADLAKYKLIIVGPDTGNYSASQTEPWGDAAGADAGYIDSTGIPVLGLWRGGGLFFKARNLYINVGNCWSGSTNEVLVLDQNLAIWNEPGKVSVGSGVITLYNNPTEFEAVVMPSPESGVLSVGRQSDNAEHYTIMIQDNKYLFWGYRGGPSLMTNKGKKVFMNVIHYLIP